MQKAMSSTTETFRGVRKGRGGAQGLWDVFVGDIGGSANHLQGGVDGVEHADDCPEEDDVGEGVGWQGPASEEDGLVGVLRSAKCDAVMRVITVSVMREGTRGVRLSNECEQIVGKRWVVACGCGGGGSVLRAGNRNHHFSDRIRDWVRAASTLVDTACCII